MPKIIFVLLAAFALLRILTFGYEYPEGKLVRISTRLSSEPGVYGNSRFIILHGLKAYVPILPEVSYGDYVVVEGKVNGDKLENVKVVSIKEGGGLFNLRRKILAIYQKALPEPHASLVAGIVLGSKSSLPESFWEKLKLSGTAHVVVASGMNVTLVISFLLSILLNVTKRYKAICFAIFGAWVYVVLSGLDAPLVRAAIMGTIAFGAQAVGRLSSAIRALFLSGLVMLIVKPEWARDLGFILSFVATLSLVLFEAKIAKALARLPLIFKKDLATTLSAQIGVAPILLATFGTFNPLSPFINALILWTVPPIMIVGAFAGLAGMVIEPLGILITYLAFPFTFWFVKVVEYLS